MSMPFSDTSTLTGIVQLLEDYTHTQSDSASSSSYPLAKKTRDINNAYANYMGLAAEATGRWQVDDTNQTDYPILYMDIVDGQDNYAFTTDENGNQVRDLYKIRMKNPAGKFIDVDQIDRTDFDINQYQDIEGTPEYYDITSNGLIFYPTPNYDMTGGIEAYVSRTPSYFTTADTTKKPGIPDEFHEYLAIRPAYYYSIKNLPSLTAQYKQEMLEMQTRIKKFYSERNKPMVNIITTEEICSI